MEFLLNSSFRIMRLKILWKRSSCDNKIYSTKELLRLCSLWNCQSILISISFQMVLNAWITEVGFVTNRSGGSIILIIASNILTFKLCCDWLETLLLKRWWAGFKYRRYGKENTFFVAQTTNQKFELQISYFHINMNQSFPKMCHNQVLSQKCCRCDNFNIWSVK